MKLSDIKAIAGEKTMVTVILACIAVLILQCPVTGQVIGQQTGSIAVSSVPHLTTVSVDNRQAGVTPVVLGGISPRTHTVLLTSPGYVPYSQQVTVQAGSVTQVYAILNQLPQNTPVVGSVRISSTPADASVYIDNRLTGVTPETVNGMSAGPHQVLLIKQGYGNYNARVTVIQGSVTSLYAVLDKTPVVVLPSGSIRITSTPSFASVSVDNRLTGVAPETINGIAPGQHQVLITKPGYLTLTKSVTVSDQQVTTVSVVLPVNPSIYF